MKDKVYALLKQENGVSRVVVLVETAEMRRENNYPYGFKNILKNAQLLGEVDVNTLDMS